MTRPDVLNWEGRTEEIETTAKALVSEELRELVAAARVVWCNADEYEAESPYDIVDHSVDRLRKALDPFDGIRV